MHAIKFNTSLNCFRYGYGKKLSATSTKEIIFYTGRVVVAMDTEKQKQRFYRKHTENITR